MRIVASPRVHRATVLAVVLTAASAFALPAPHLLKDINTAATGVGAITPIVAGDTVFFAGNDGVVGKELWKSDGTPAGTVLVKDIWPGRAGGIGGPEPFVGLEAAAAGGKLFLLAVDGQHGSELWVSDG